jgi:cell division protein ZipA
MEHGIVTELRWTLLVVGAVFVAVLAWWERRRRPRQAGGALERRAARDSGGESASAPAHDSPLTLPQMRAGEPLGARESLGAREPLATYELPVVELPSEAEPEPVLEPPAAAADVDDSTDVTLERTEEAAATESGSDPPVGESDAAAAGPPSAPAGVPLEVLPELPPAPSPRVDWPPGEGRRILALRLVAPVAERFAGRSLRQALAAEGFVLGRFAIFHKPDEQQRAILSAANLTRPGTFDMQTMDSQRYGGLSLFAVLPGPKSPPQAFDELVFTARNLNQRLNGVLQDEAGSPLTPARVAQLREQLHAGAPS